MSLTIRKTTGNDAGIVTEPANNNNDTISSEMNQTVDVTYTTVLQNVKPNKKQLNYAAPLRVEYQQVPVAKNALNSSVGRTSINKKLPSLLSYNPPLQTTIRKLSLDLVNNAVSTNANDNIQLVTSAGVSSLDLRPEIISILDLSPMWRQEPKNSNINAILERQYTDTGMFLKFSHQTKLLRQETLIATLKDIKRVTKQDKTFNDIRNDYLNEINIVGNNMMFFKNILENIDVIKKSFDIKLIPDTKYKVASKSEAITPLRMFYSENMGFTTGQYETFSDTKILLQLLYDLNTRLKTYSFKFLDQVNLTRKNDFSPIRIDVSENSPGYKFDISNFTSTTNQPINASVSATFNRFINLLPSDADSRIKLLTYILAKEYIVSSNLGNTNNNSILQKFRAPNVGNSFANIIGDISPNILQIPNNRNGLSFLPYTTIPNSTNTIVLAFEKKFIEDPDNNNTSWVPGDNYFTEKIINPTGNTWDISSYNAYVTNYNDTTQNAANLIRRLLGIDLQESQTSLITPMMLNKQILQAFYTAFDKVTPIEEDVAAKFDPAVYAEKLALQQQKEQLETELNSLKASIPTGDVSVSSIGDGSEANQVNNWRPHPEDLEREVEKLRNNPRIPLLEAKLIEINQRINELNVPNPNILQNTIEQAMIMNIFNVAGDYADLKNMLFQYCILAGLVRNKSNETNGIFNILARNEINKIQNLDVFAAFETLTTIFGGTSNTSTTTIDGLQLLQSLKQLAGTIAERYIKIFIILSNTGTQSVLGFNSGKTVDLIMSEADVANVLERAALGQGTIGNTNLIYQYINLANSLFSSAQVNGTNVHLLSDNSGRTRLSSLSCSTQLFMLFEIFCQYSKKYSFIKPNRTITQDNFGYVQVETSEELPIGVIRFDKKGDTAVFTDENTGTVNFTTTTLTETKTGVLKFLVFKVDLTNTSLVQKSIEILSRDYKEQEAETERRQNPLFISLEDNKNKIAKEYSDIDTIISIFEVIGNNLNNALSQAKQFFTQTGLKQFLATSTISNLDLIKNISQIRISAQALNEIKEKTRVPTEYVTARNSSETKEIDLIVSDVPTVNSFNLLEKMMKNYTPGTSFSEEQYRRNYKVISVGLPTGFCKVLFDRISRKNINTISFQERQSDIIYVNVYVRNAKYPDLIFKPTKYVFDTSLFVTNKNINDAQPQVGESYTAVLNRMALTDFEDPFNPIEIDLDALKADPKYNGLKETQFSELLYNHVNSYLFGTYMSLHTGVKPSEDTFTFPEPAERVLNSKVKGLISAYLQQLKLTAPSDKQVTSQILSDPNISDTVKDLYRICTYGSLVLNTNEVINRVLVPKLYDRIFYIPIQTYALEIDVAKTKLYNQNINFDLYRDYLTIDQSGKYILRDGDADQFIVKDIFVQVETLPNTVTLTEIIGPNITNLSKIGNISSYFNSARANRSGQALGNINILNKNLFRK